MNPIERIQFLQTLRDRRDAIATEWRHALVRSSFLSLSADDVHQHLLTLVDHVIMLLFSESFERDKAQAVGSALADLHYLDSESLGRTLEVLAHHLVDGLRPDQIAALQSRLVALLSELVIGFSKQTRVTTLAEQEEIRSAFLTERQRVEDALRNSEVRFRTIFEGAAVGIAVVDMKGRMLETNPALSKMIGYRTDELRDMISAAILHPDDHDLGVYAYNRLVDGTSDRYETERRYVRKDGEVLWGRVTVSLVCNHAGYPLFTIGMLEDITERKQVERELEETRHRLIDNREAERLQIAQEMHDGPMQELYGVRFRLKALMDSVQDPTGQIELKTARERLYAVAIALRSLCRDLRPSTLTPFGVEGAIHSHLEHFREAHPEVVVKAALIPDGQALPESVRLALYRIYQQAMYNIIQHAGPCTVMVRFEVDAERILLEVRDNGHGFVPPKRWVDLARQGHLGLLGAVERAEAIGGGLEIESVPGKGTVVRVVAPSAEQVDDEIGDLPIAAPRGVT